MTHVYTGRNRHSVSLRLDGQGEALEIEEDGWAFDTPDVGESHSHFHPTDP